MLYKMENVGRGDTVPCVQSTVKYTAHSVYTMTELQLDA